MDYEKSFLEKFNKVNDGSYVLSSKYKNSKSRITIYHAVCKNSFIVYPRDFLNGSVKCSCERKRKKQDDYLRKLEDMNIGVKIANELYQGLNKPLNHICVCGNVWRPTPASVLKGANCPDCMSKKLSKTHEDFANEVSEATNGEYVCIGEYKGSREKVKILHKKCNYSWEIIANNFLSKKIRCPKCRRVKRKTTEDFKEEVFELTEDEYSVIGEYKNIRTPVLLRHNQCDYEWEIRPSGFLSGNRCPNCNDLKGSGEIKKSLKKRNIKYTVEKRFNGCRSEKKLPFDFYLEDLNILIEYDGQHHFRPVNFGGVSEKRAKILHERTKSHDEIKNNYCLKNNLILFRIPFWQYDTIDSIISKIVKYQNGNNFDKSLFLVNKNDWKYEYYYNFKF